MLFTKIFAAAAFVATASARIAFTTLPSSVQAGQPVRLAWSGSDGSPVTITLKKGNADDLKTVQVITGSATGSSFTWTPSTDLPNGKDYALQISQGVDDVNFSGLFSLGGGKAAGSTITTSASASATATDSKTTTELTTVTSANSTVSVVSTVFTTGTAPLSGATGTTVSRNTTFSSATLSSTRGSRTTGASESGSSASATSTEPASSSGAAVPLKVQAGGIGAGALVAALFFL